jgi:2-methylcitrate dehydratase
VQSRKYSELSKDAIRELKIRLLDSLGCAIGADEGDSIKMIRQQIEDFGGNPLTSLIGRGKTAPDRVSLLSSLEQFRLYLLQLILGRNSSCYQSIP